MPPREGNDVGCNKMPAARGNGMQLVQYLKFLICQNTLVIPTRDSSSRAKQNIVMQSKRLSSRAKRGILVFAGDAEAGGETRTKVPRFARDDSPGKQPRQNYLRPRFILRMRQRL